MPRGCPPLPQSSFSSIKMMCGGVGGAEAVTDEVKALVLPLRDLVQAKAQALGHGLFTMFEPVSFASQV